MKQSRWRFLPSLANTNFLDLQSLSRTRGSRSGILMPFYKIPVPRPPSLGIGGGYFKSIRVRRRCFDVHLETAKAVFAH